MSIWSHMNANMSAQSKLSSFLTTFMSMRIDYGGFT